MGLCASKLQQQRKVDRKKSALDFAAIHEGGNADDSIEKNEFATYIDNHAELWAMLVVNLNLDEQTCKRVAVDVAFNMVVTKVDNEVNDSGNDSENGGGENNPKKARRISTLRIKSKSGVTMMTKEQFFEFQQIVKDPKGQLEFFHRTVFQAFDTDNNGVLDAKELDSFLETFYSVDSIFKGDARLPPKNELKKIIHERFDADGDGQLSFDEIQTIISGKADLSSTDVNPVV